MIKSPKAFYSRLDKIVDGLVSFENCKMIEDDWNGLPCFAWLFYLGYGAKPNGTLRQIADLMCQTEYACLGATSEGELYIKVIFQKPVQNA